jgi:hypothetical protein
MMHVHLPPLVTALAVINTAIAACKFGAFWRQDSRRRLQLAVFVAALVAAVVTLVVAIIMNVFRVSVTDQLGHEKLRKAFLCSVVLNCAISEAFQVHLLTSMQNLILIFSRLNRCGISTGY